MTAARRFHLVAAMLAAVLALGACSSGPKGASSVSSVAPTSADEIDEIAALLDRGQPGAAKRRIERALERDPMNPSLMVLLQGIERDARKALGPASYAYTVQPGDTMPGLAERFLGNRLKSYQLAQYNDIDTPADLAPGAVLRIPGQSQRVDREPRSTPAASTPRERPAVAAPKPAPEPEPPARKSADPAAAQRARAAGLAALNQGKIPQALTLLRRAAALDSGNDAIAADLARAERIARTVRSRR